MRPSIHRTVVYEQALRSKHPKRGSQQIRQWSPPYEVWLNRPTVGHRNRLAPEKTVRKVDTVSQPRMILWRPRDGGDQWRFIHKGGMP